MKRIKEMNAVKIFATIIKYIGFIAIGAGLALMLEGIYIGYACIIIALSIIDIIGSFIVINKQSNEENKEET